MAVARSPERQALALTVAELGGKIFSCPGKADFLATPDTAWLPHHAYKIPDLATGRVQKIVYRPAGRQQHADPQVGWGLAACEKCFSETDSKHPLALAEAIFPSTGLNF